MLAVVATKEAEAAAKGATACGVLSKVATMTTASKAGPATANAGPAGLVRRKLILSLQKLALQRLRRRRPRITEVLER